MRLLQIFLLILAIPIEIAIFIWGYRLSKQVFWGQISSVRKQLGISILSGIPVGLLLIIVALILGLIDENYEWTITGITGVVFIAFILFILATIGSIWRFFIAGKFRTRLFKKLRNTDKNR